jgi:hypothetical protein
VDSAKAGHPWIRTTDGLVRTLARTNHGRGGESDAARGCKHIAVRSKILATTYSGIVVQKLHFFAPRANFSGGETGQLFRTRAAGGQESGNCFATLLGDLVAMALGYLVDQSVRTQ